jgi:hypothetical protein
MICPRSILMPVIFRRLIEDVSEARSYFLDGESTFSCSRWGGIRFSYTDSPELSSNSVVRFKVSVDSVDVSTFVR